MEIDDGMQWHADVLVFSTRCDVCKDTEGRLLLVVDANLFLALTLVFLMEVVVSTTVDEVSELICS